MRSIFLGPILNTDTGKRKINPKRDTQYRQQGTFRMLTSEFHSVRGVAAKFAFKTDIVYNEETAHQ